MSKETHDYEICNRTLQRCLKKTQDYEEKEFEDKRKLQTCTQQ